MRGQQLSWPMAVASDLLEPPPEYEDPLEAAFDHVKVERKLECLLAGHIPLPAGDAIKATDPARQLDSAASTAACARREMPAAPPQNLGGSSSSWCRGSRRSRLTCCPA